MIIIKGDGESVEPAVIVCKYCRKRLVYIEGTLPGNKPFEEIMVRYRHEDWPRSPCLQNIRYEMETLLVPLPDYIANELL